MKSYRLTSRLSSTNRTPRRRIGLVSAGLPALVGLVLALATGAQAASISWGVPRTISADTDVLTAGSLEYAYDLANVAQTLNTVPFAAGNNRTNLGAGNITMSGFTGWNGTTFGNTTVTPWNNLTAAYKNVLKGAAYGNTSPATINLNNLTVGRAYLVQIWVDDSRTDGNGRTESVTSAGGRTIALDYNSTDVAGGVGQYTAGTFTADATSQSFTLTGSVSSQLNAIQVRYLQPTNGVWTNAASGLNWSTPGNWTNSQVPSGFAASADFNTLDLTADSTVHLDAPVTIGNLVLGDTDTNTAAGWILDNNGNAANFLTLSGPASLITVNSLGDGKTATISSDIAGQWGLGKDGLGTLVLSGSNTYTGGTMISSGILSVSAIADSGLSAIGASGTLNFAGGTLAFTGTTGSTYRPLTFTGPGVIDVPSGATLSLNPTNASATATVAKWTGNGGITKNGLGTLNVGLNGSPANAADRFTVGPSTGGTFTMNAGTLNIAPKQYFTLPDASGASGTFIQNGGTVNFTPAIGSDLYMGNSSALSSILTINNGLFNMGTNQIRVGISTGTSTLTVGNGAGSTATVSARTIYRYGGTGNLILDGGTLKATMANSTFLYSLTTATVNPGGAFIDDSGFAITISQALSDGGGGLTKLGSGVLTLTGANAYSGPTTNSAGTLQVGAGGAAGQLGSGAVENNGTLVFNRSDSVTVYNVINGPGDVVHAGAGTTTLASVNTYSGQTIVSNGTLVVWTGSTTNGAYTVRDGTTLGVALQSAGGSLVVSNLTLGSFSQLTFDLSAISGDLSAPALTNAGSLTLNGTVIVNVAGSGFTPLGTNVLFRYAGPRTGSGMFVDGVLPVIPGYAAHIVDDSANQQVLLIVTLPSNDLLWTGTVNTNWNTTDTNWVLSGTSTPTNFITYDNTRFDDTASNFTVNLPADVMPGSVTVSNESQNYVLTGSALIGGTGLVKEGAGSLTVANNNAYVDATTISGGTLQVGNGGTNGSLGFGAILNNASLVYDRSDSVTNTVVISGTGSVTNQGSGSLTLAAANTYDGSTTIAAGTVVADNNAALGSTLAGTTVANGATLDIGGTAAPAARDLGAEVITLSGTGVGGNGALVNNSTNDQINAVERVVLGSAASIGGVARWDIRGTGNSLDLGGYTLTKTATNYVALVSTTVTNASNPADPGNINIAQGTFGLQLSTTLGGSSTNTLTVASGARLEYYQLTAAPIWTLVLNAGSTNWSENGTGTQNNWAGPVLLNGPAFLDAQAVQTISGNISGGGSLTKVGGNTATLSGSNTFTGPTTISLGKLSVSSLNSVNGGTPLLPGSSLGAPTNVLDGTIAIGSTTNAATLAYTGTNGETSDRVISLAGSTGGAVIEHGSTNLLKFTSDLAAPGAAGTDQRKTLTLQGSTPGAGEMAGKIVDSSLGNAGEVATSVTKAGTGTWTLSAANTYTGPTTISGGTLAVSADNNLGAVPGAVASNNVVINGGTLAATASFTLDSNRGILVGLATGSGAGTLDVATNQTLVYGGVVANNAAGVGSLTKTGPGTLAVSGASTYGGVTTITGGILDVANFSNYGFPGGLGQRAADSSPGNVGILFRGGTLRYSGSTPQSTDRAIRISTTGGGATIDASGSTLAATLSFTASSSPDFFENNGDRTLTLTGSNAGDNTFGMAIGEPTGKTTLVKDGAGTWVLTGASYYTGPTLINAGKLQLGNGGSSGLLSPGSAITNNGTLVFKRAGTLTQGVDFATNITGSGGVVQSGAGTVILSGTNTYTGPTDITSGTLSLRGALGTNSVTVYSGGTLGGTGVISGPVTIQTGGAITPGVSTVVNESLALGSSLSLSGTTTIEIGQLGLILASDYITVAGDITYGGTLVVTNANGAALTNGNVFALFGVTGAKNGNFANSNSVTVLPASLNLTGTFDPATGNLTLATVVGPSIPPYGTNLTYSATSSNITLSWPSNYTGAYLQVQTNLLNKGLSTNWVTLEGSQTNNAYTLPLNKLDPTVFFRMVHTNAP
jgi:autotransporter-associated beta strand protein